MGLFKKKSTGEIIPPPPPVPNIDVEDIGSINPTSDAEDEITNAIEKIKKIEAKEKKPSFFSRLFKPKAKKAESDGGAETNASLKPETNNLEAINSLIKSARNYLLDLKIEEAKRDYLEIIKIYNMLSLDGQKKIYEEIQELYNERKNAEALNLKI